MTGYDNDHAFDFAPARRSRACLDCGGWGSHHALCPSAPADDEDEDKDAPPRPRCDLPGRYHGED